MNQSQNLLPNGYLHLAIFLTILLLLILITDLGEFNLGSGFCRISWICVSMLLFSFFFRACPLFRPLASLKSPTATGTKNIHFPAALASWTLLITKSNFANRSFCIQKWKHASVWPALLSMWGDAFLILSFCLFLLTGGHILRYVSIFPACCFLSNWATLAIRFAQTSLRFYICSCFS